MVAKNHCLMKLRDSRKFTTGINEELLATPDEATEKVNYVEKDKKLNNMAAALQQLNKEQQLCVTLFYLEKKSYQQIVDQTSYNLMQVKSHIQNGKRNLKKLMEELEEGNRQ